jgi:hypothetical protein
MTQDEIARRDAEKAWKYNLVELQQDVMVKELLRRQMVAEKKLVLDFIGRIIHKMVRRRTAKNTARMFNEKQKAKQAQPK